MSGFTPISHHDVLVLFVQLAILLLAARALGEVALRLGQPSVVGEILAGIILGPSLLSTFVPFVGQWVMPHSPEQGHLLEVISLMGALFLMLITGLETDLALVRRHARTALGVSWVGLLVTFLTTFVMARFFLPAFLVPETTPRLVFALFVAIPLSISSISVIAKVLIDLKLVRRDVGQIVLASSTSDELLAWIMVSVVAGLAAAGGVPSAGNIAQAIGSVLLFLLASFTVGRWLVKRALDFVQDEVISRERLLSLVIIFTFAWGAMTQALGLEVVLGALIMGFIFGQMPRLPDTVVHSLEGIALGIFAPIFFAVAGLRVNLLDLFGNPQLLLVALGVILVVMLAKYTGTYLGGRLIGGRDHWTALSFSAGLNIRGTMEIVIASVGLNLGILSEEMFSIVVLLALTSSLLSPSVLRWILRRVQPEEQELTRLRQEELAVGSMVAGIHRVLIPVRGRQNIIESAHIIEQLATSQALSVTLFHVECDGEASETETLMKEAESLFPSVELVTKVVSDPNAAEAILNEAQKHYDLLMLGAPESDHNTEGLFAPMVDYLVRLAPCPTMIVKGSPSDEHWPPRRILVPTNGSRASRNAAEVSFALAPDGQTSVTVLNVVVQRGQSQGHTLPDRLQERQIAVAHQVVEGLRELGEARGTRTDADVRVGERAVPIILDVANQRDMDLIVLGTDVRAGSNHLSLGPRVERIIEGAPCPVIVINAS